MKILMVTNTYLPHVGGVARSVETFSQCYREKGHEVLIIAPEFKGTPQNEKNVIRIPAIQNFNGSDFSVRLPIPTGLYGEIDEFGPDIVHSHHPFLLGDTALRVAAHWDLPIVFTHHTMYERYTHYVPGDSKAMKRFAVALATGYANLCHHVIAPSESIARIIRRRGVDTPVSVIPTGIDLKRFETGDGNRVREKYGISRNMFVIGHVGRLAAEKNLQFLCTAVIHFLKKHPNVFFLIAGSGTSEAEINKIFYRHKLEDRLILSGKLTGQDLVDVYHSMDLFVFASKTETQGVVLAEAMGAGVPVVALNAPGVREIVKDGDNGFLVTRENVRQFAKAIEQFYILGPADRKGFINRAKGSARQYDQHACAVRALHIYEESMALIRTPLKSKKSLWEKILRQMETEWSLISTKARAAGLGRLLYKYQPFIILERFRRYARRLVSRASWSTRLLKLSKTTDDPASNGLILLQIDGLSRFQFERALRSGRLPFLRRLLTRQAYSLCSFYSGIPSTTPAVQGELFYGKKTAVPAFSFFDHETGVTAMLNPATVKKVEKELRETASEGLLDSGSCYCDIYQGGASEAHFCPSAFGWKGFLNKANPLRIALVLLMHSFILLRIGALLTIEVVLAFLDCIHGVIKGEHLFQELKFVPSRVSVCILLRELSTAGALIDINRGLPIIHVNFFGYDEQSHRRGPDSYFAHWTLKGIDRAIRMIWQAARKANKRNYQVWIYSDHGQERTVSYRDINKRTVHDALAEILEADYTSQPSPDRYQDSTEFNRSAMVGGWLGKLISIPKKAGQAQRLKNSKIIVTAKGPLGHVYTPQAYSAEQKKVFARRMVEEARIPLVLVQDDDNHCLAFTREATIRLPEEGNLLFDETLPYFKELTKDIVSLCNHKNAGDFIISGWSPHADPISFPIEKGAHGGPGPHETHGVVLLPRSFAGKYADKKYLRGENLRDLALSQMKRVTNDPVKVGVRPLQKNNFLRIMTYNAHGCRGMDNLVLPERLAEVITQYAPDVVCLQEVAMGGKILFGDDQAEEIACAFNAEFNYPPPFIIKAEQYGIVILSQFPIRLVKSAKLPGLPGRPNLEERGAIWVELAVRGQKFQIISTHLGLLEKERDIQTNKLLGEKWLLHPLCDTKTVFCGDLNLNPGSFNHVMISRRFKDVQETLQGHALLKTWPSRYPLRMLDYIFVSRDLHIRSIEVPKNQLTMVSSDHLPLIVDIDIEP